MNEDIEEKFQVVIMQIDKCEIELNKLIILAKKTGKFGIDYRKFGKDYLWQAKEALWRMKKVFAKDDVR